MAVVAQINPFNGENFYMISTETLANGHLHPDNVYETEEEAYQGQKEMAEFILHKMDNNQKRGRKSIQRENVRAEANRMIKESIEFGV